MLHTVWRGVNLETGWAILTVGEESRQLFPTFRKNPIKDKWKKLEKHLGEKIVECCDEHFSFNHL